MNEADLIGVHEAWITHHVAAVCKVYGQHCSATILYSAGAVVMKLFVIVSIDVATGKHLFNVRQKLGIDRHHIFNVPMYRTILDHPDFVIALIVPPSEFAKMSIYCSLGRLHPTEFRS